MAAICGRKCARGVPKGGQPDRRSAPLIKPRRAVPVQLLNPSNLIEALGFLSGQLSKRIDPLPIWHVVQLPLLN